MKIGNGGSADASCSHRAHTHDEGRQFRSATAANPQLRGDSGLDADVRHGVEGFAVTSVIDRMACAIGEPHLFCNWDDPTGGPEWCDRCGEVEWVETTGEATFCIEIEGYECPHESRHHKYG